MAEPASRSPDPGTPWLTAGRAFPLLVLGELILNGVDLSFGPWITMHWEELFNARAGVQFACGHLGAIDAMQYRTFCGGCTGEGLMAVPLFQALGPTVLVWKWMLVAFHIGIVAAGGWLLKRAVGPLAACAFVLLMAAAPGWYRELTHTGWGNHVECAVFPLVAAVLLSLAQDRGRPAKAGLLFTAGAIAGLGVWFGQTSAWAIPALMLGSWVAARWLAPLFPAGMAVGLIPLFDYYRDKPRDTDATLDWWSALDVAPPSALWDWLAGPYLRESIWAAREYGELGAWPGLWWFVLWGVALVGLGRLALQMRWGVDLADRVASWLFVLSLPVLVVIYWLRYDLWSNLPDLYVNEAFNLRYRTPLVPLLFLGAAAGLGWPWRKWRLRLPLLLCGLLLVGYGLSRRASQWTAWRGQVLDLRLYLHDGWPDKVVPMGDPPQPRRQSQGRPTDIQVALDFLGDHDDAFEDCRLDHVFELGRRLGLAAGDAERTDVAKWIPLAAPHITDPLPRRMFAEGLARSLMDDAGKQVPHIATRLDELDAALPGLGTAVGNTAGRRAAGAFHPDRDGEHAATLDPRVWTGVCEGRGLHRARAITGDGRQPPRLGTDRTLIEAGAGDCRQTPAYAAGLGFGWARYAGCGAAHLADFKEELGTPPGDDAIAAHHLGCSLYRWSARTPAPEAPY